MRRIYFPFICLLVSIFSLFQTSCQQDNSIGLSATDLEINEFIWSGLHNYYLWVDSVPNLASSRFSSDNDWTAYLGGYADHEKLFYDLLYNYETVDKWSWIVDDYEALLNQFQGISLSMGYVFRLVQYSNSNDVFGFVRYVVKGSPADLAGIKRGDVFIAVDGTQLTVDNYQTLLFTNTTYTLSFAYIVDHSVISNGKTLSLTAAVVYENPIYLDTVLSVNNIKIGYLVYNGFMSDYDIRLNEAFQSFKNQGIQKLILDLRYNPGGSVQSAIYLASMIYSTDTNKIFIRTKFNTDFEAFLSQNYGNSYFATTFTDRIDKTDQTPEMSINSLNLNQVYIITTGSTASASELVINGLKPYMDVTTIGTKTVGKYVGSMTILDYNDSGEINPNHKWALQPIVLKIANSAGVTDFVNGLTPTDSVREDIGNLLPFGDVNETLLKATLDYITGNSTKSSPDFYSDLDFKKVADSKDFIPHCTDMYFNFKDKKLLTKYRLKKKK
jgi:carboxyl-terminal processing protease